MDTVLHEDAMLREWETRASASDPQALDIANCAMERAEQTAAILTGDRAGTDPVRIEDVRKRLQRVRDIAVLVGRAHRARLTGYAQALAAVAEGEALKLDAMDHARIDGLKRPVPFPTYNDHRGARVRAA